MAWEEVEEVEEEQEEQEEEEHLSSPRCRCRGHGRHQAGTVTRLQQLLLPLQLLQNLPLETGGVRCQVTGVRWGKMKARRQLSSAR